MSDIQLAHHAFYSSDYLHQLVEHGQTYRFSKTDQYQLNLQNDVQADGALVIFAQGLNLEKIWQVTAGISAHLTVLGFRRRRSLLGQLVIELAANLNNDKGMTEAIESLAMQLQVEINWLTKPPALSQPGLLLMDMDSTVIDVECIDEIAKLAGVGDKVAAVTELAMQGKLDFAASLQERVACLKNTDESVLAQVRDALPLMPGLQALVKTLKQHDWKVAIASGGFTFFADYLSDRLGLDAAVANQLVIENGKLTGKTQGNIVDAQTKADTLLSLAEKWSIPIEQTVAMGDGANDLVMMQAAGLGVAFHAKPLVRAQADTSIRHSGLDAMLAYLNLSNG